MFTSTAHTCYQLKERADQERKNLICHKFIGALTY